MGEAELIAKKTWKMALVAVIIYWVLAIIAKFLIFWPLGKPLDPWIVQPDEAAKFRGTIFLLLPIPALIAGYLGARKYFGKAVNLKSGLKAGLTIGGIYGIYSVIGFVLFFNSELLLPEIFLVGIFFGLISFLLAGLGGIIYSFIKK